jgi:hypothetical protein
LDNVYLVAYLSFSNLNAKDDCYELISIKNEPPSVGISVSRGELTLTRWASPDTTRKSTAQV